MADVYLAVVMGPAGFSKLQVLKRLRPRLADEPELRTMFLDEARLNHRNVVQTNERLCHLRRPDQDRRLWHRQGSAARHRFSFEVALKPKPRVDSGSSPVPPGLSAKPDPYGPVHPR